MKKTVFAAVAALGLVASAANASTIFSFGNISANNVNDAMIGESQLFVEVSAGPGANQASFRFFNTGPEASSIADIYFDDGTLLGIASIIDDGGVTTSFSQNASPGNLPSANSISPAFVTTMDFSADSDPPTQPMGVNPGEEVTIIFDLMGGGTINDVLAELDDGRLRIGIHVQGFDSGGSESFVNNGPPPVIPLPSAAGIGLVGLAGLGFIRRRR